MILGEGLFGLAVLVLWAYCIFDVIRTDESLVQNLPKMLWLLIVVFVPTIGSIAWLLLGRPSGAAFNFDASPRREREQEPMHPSIGYPERRLPPDDHQARRDEALRRHQAEREEELRRREEELRRREEELRRKEEGPVSDQAD